MKNRRAIVTGAYGAIGRAIAEGLAQQNYSVALTGRNESMLKEVAESIKDATNNQNISWHVVDLSRKKEVENFSKTWKDPLHLLINNAATTPRSRKETPEGIELQFATNVLGYFWMTEYLHPFMKNQDDARIINVCSYWAGDLDLDDLEFKKRIYDNDRAYRQTKAANRMLSGFYARKLQGDGIAVMAAHPGDVKSGVSRGLGYGGSDSPWQAAETPLYCATHPSLKGTTGKYFEHMRESYCPFAAREHEAEQLYRICKLY